MRRRSVRFLPGSTLRSPRLALRSAIIQTVNVGASVRPLHEDRRRSTCHTMSSTAPSRPSVSATSKKKSSPSAAAGHSARTRATSTEDLALSATSPSIKRESSSGFNYQTLPDNTPVTLLGSKSKPPVRSHSSNNAELTYHLQQLKSLNKRKTTFSDEDPSNHNARLHLTSSNSKIVCSENGRETSIHSVNSNTTVELPVSWKPAVQQVTPPRDSWDHKIEFLLAVIGYAVDLGE